MYIVSSYSIWARSLLLVSAVTCAAVPLAGCWTAPVANVQPKGEARLIQAGIHVVAVKDDATVQSIDANLRTLVLGFSDGTTATLRPGPRLENLSKIRAGDKGRATIEQELSVYVLKNGQLLSAEGKSGPIKSHAKVLIVEPSYRLLTLAYTNRTVETFKVPLQAKLQDMEPGDEVVIETTDLLALRVQQ